MREPCLKTKEKIQQEDHQQIEDFREDSITREEFVQHCKENSETSLKLDKIMWLSDDEVKTTIKRIIKDEEGKTWLSIQVANWLKIISIVVAIISGLFAINKYIK